MDDVDELEDVDGRPGSQEHHAQTNRHLEESVEFPVLSPPDRAEKDGEDDEEGAGDHVVDKDAGDKQVDGGVLDEVAVLGLRYQSLLGHKIAAWSEFC